MKSPNEAYSNTARRRGNWNRAAKVNLIAVWQWFKGKSRDALRASLQASREAYRRALRHKRGMTESEFYEAINKED